MTTMTYAENRKRITIKRKVYARGKKQNFKRFKKTPKFIKNNPENQVAREKAKEEDAYHFTDSEDDHDDLGMGLELSDLPFLDEPEKDKQLIALTQDSVRPLFTKDSPVDETMINDALAEMRYTSFRPYQKEAIIRILQGRSTLFISPTGSGKSLCFQLPALLYWRFKKYMTIVVSPLISLMDDQMKNFPSALKAVSLHSGSNKTQKQNSINQLKNGDAQVVFISPEAIVGGVLDLEDLKNLPPVGFVCIDEAHCLSEWSHNFRPAYLQFIKILHEQMSIKTYLGLTATATKATSFAISKNLIINPETDVIGSTTIPDNLILSVSFEGNKEKALTDLLKSPTFRIMPSIIVYCNRREETDHVASIIRTSMQAYSNLIEIPERTKATGSKDDSTRSNTSNEGSPSEKPHMKLSWHAESYHAGLSMETRKRIQRQFVKGEIRVVVATIAFGMGINKANVRAIIHFDMPSSFESYVQEIGRAGRDGKPAQCHMFLKADASDLYYQQRNIYASVTDRANLKKLVSKIFKPCHCEKFLKKGDVEKLEELNRKDPHQIKRNHRTKFTDTIVDDSEEDDDLELSIENQEQVEKENRPTKYARESVVRKHRACKGHEVAFPINETAEEIDLKPENIITLICQIQQAYPQLQIRQYSPAKSVCRLFCYKGASQMKSLAESSKPVKIALWMHRRDHLKNFGDECETPTELKIDIFAIASMMGRSSTDIIRMLKQTEWELVENTGRFRRSQVRVKFEGNSFHLNCVGDLNDNEIKELYNFLVDFNKLYEDIQRDKIRQVFTTMRRHCISVEKMKDKSIRLEVSSRLKSALNNYFNSTPDQQAKPTSEDSNNQLSNLENHQPDMDTNIISAVKRQAIEKSAKGFIEAHSVQEFTPRIIARIFQGISSVKYPAEHWGMNKKWWRIHLDVDFIQLVGIIENAFTRTN